MSINRTRADGPSGPLRGRNMVGAAFTMLLVLATSMAAIQVGIALFTYQTMTEGARRALRYAADNPYDVDSIRNMAVYGNAAGAGVPFGGLNPTRVTIESQPIDSTSSLVQVAVTLPSNRFFAPLFPTLPFGMSTTAVRVAEGIGVKTKAAASSTGPVCGQIVRPNRATSIGRRRSSWHAARSRVRTHLAAQENTYCRA